MDEYTIRQAVDLIKARRFNDARKLLRPVLEVSPTNEAAWVWFGTTYSGPAERLQVYQVGLLFCENSEELRRNVQKAESEIQELKLKGEEPEPLDIISDLPQIARAKLRENRPKLWKADEPVAWGQPFTGSQQKAVEAEQTQTGLERVTGKLISLPSGTPQAAAPLPPATLPEESLQSDWIDALRGTMSAETQEDRNAEDQSPLGMGAERYPLGGEGPAGVFTEQEETTPPLSEQPVPPFPPELHNEKETTTSRWLLDRFKHAPQKQVPFVEPPSAEGTTFAVFMQPEGEEGVTLHPEFFETPAPPAAPEPIVEPVVVWGSQIAPSVSDDRHFPWEYQPPAAETSSLEPDAAEGKTNQLEKGNPPDPYEAPFKFVLWLGIALMVILILILTVDYLP